MKLIFKGENCKNIIFFESDISFMSENHVEKIIFHAILSPATERFFMQHHEADICVVGGGSGGFAAAIRAAQSGLKTILAEKEMILGGTSTVCGVNCWEPVAGAAYGLPAELYEEMKKIPGGCGIYHCAMHFCFNDPDKKNFPGGLYRIDPQLAYEDTLKRGYIYGGPWSQDLWNGVIFEPEILNRCILKMLHASGCQVLTGSACSEVFCENNSIKKIKLRNGTEISAKYWIDNCGILASAAKCRIFMGQDPAALFGEPDAPEEPDLSRLNGATMLFRITRKKQQGIDPFEGVPRKGCMVATEYPNGDYCCNMLPTMNGAEFFAMERETALAECENRISAFWNYVQLNYEWGRNYKISNIFHNPGIRETFRIQCDYMLNENDLISGLQEQDHEDMIAVADHHMDLHGAPGTGKRVVPYGIPYRCLLAKGMENLLIAGRIGGFSCLAASSCRLSRTMIRLGEAAGYAAALALQKGKPLRELPAEKLQDLMKFRKELEIAGFSIRH